tara:strand:- start:109 stop:1023 length:915 start_codon:yes stop_codon:yes gene_type:complete
MNVLDGPSIANLCDYDFGDQAGCIGGVPGAFMVRANETNKNFLNIAESRDCMTLFIDNIRLYQRKITCNNDADQRHVDGLMAAEDLMKLCKSLPDTKFIIFCSNEDTPIHDDIDVPDNVLGIFAANAIGYSKKVHPLPYGVQRKLHDADNRKDLLKIFMKVNSKPKKLLYINHSESTNISERGNIREMFADKPFATVSPHVDYATYYKMITEHKFMICPEGNAVDCHRNWEVLCLKRVPIMKKNPYLQECYKNFPILWVDDYADVDKILLAENDHLYVQSRNLDINLLDLYSIFNRSVIRAKNT